MFKALISLSLLLMAAVAIADDFTLKSSAIHEKDKMPVKYTCDGEDISPPLSWGSAPTGTESFVMVLNVTDFDSFQVFLWVLYNIPNTVTSFPQDLQELPGDTLALVNIFGQKNYRGPCPPAGHLHHYTFTIYALNRMLSPQAEDMDPQDFLRLIKPYIIKQSTLSVLYGQ